MSGLIFSSAVRAKIEAAAFRHQLAIGRNEALQTPLTGVFLEVGIAAGQNQGDFRIEGRSGGLRLADIQARFIGDHFGFTGRRFSLGCCGFGLVGLAFGLRQFLFERGDALFEFTHGEDVG